MYVQKLNIIKLFNFRMHFIEFFLEWMKFRTKMKEKKIILPDSTDGECDDDPSTYMRIN